MSADRDRAESERTDAAEPPTGTAGPDDPTRQAVRYAARHTAVVALLAGAFGVVTRFGPTHITHEYMALSRSGLGAVVAYWVVRAFLATVVALFVLTPVAVAGYRLLAGTSRRAVAEPFLSAMAAPVVVVAAMVGVSFTVWGSLLALVVALLVLLRGLTRWHDDPGAAVVAAGNHAVVAIALVGLLAGPVVGLPLGLAVEVYDSGSPSASFDYETAPAGDGTRVTVVHAGGDRVRADGLTLRVVNDSDPRSEARVREWNGSTTYVEGRGPRRAGRYVVPGNATTITVPDDCVVRVVWERDGETSTLGKHRCGAGGDEWTPTPFPDPTVPGDSG